MTMPTTWNPVDSFWARVARSTECWEWLGARSPLGYGKVKRGGRVLWAHRYAYAITRGPIEPGVTVDHICFNPSCVRPAHLQLLSNEANAQRQQSALATHCARGHAFTPENTWGRPSKGHGRRCKACQQERIESRRAS